jgi:acyl-CoA thioester hydrolase
LKINLEQLASLPVYHRATIQPEHLDELGHMNVRWYMALFSDATVAMLASFGMDMNYTRQAEAGSFALKHFIHYLAEVRLGEQVALRARVLGRNEKRLHYVLFMVNESQHKLAATAEALAAHADLNERRTSPFPPHIAAAIDHQLVQHRQLDWAPKLSGAISL